MAEQERDPAGCLRVDEDAHQLARVSRDVVDVGAIIQQSLAGLPYPPRELNRRIAVAVTEKTPFTLIAKLDRPEAARGVPLSALSVTSPSLEDVYLELITR